MADEDFDWARHRLRQELTARNTDQPADRPLTARSVIPQLPGADWVGSDEPEQADRDAMANYNRCVIAEAARTTSPSRINWLAVGLWGFLALTVLYYTAQIIRWAVR